MHNQTRRGSAPLAGARAGARPRALVAAAAVALAASLAGVAGCSSAGGSAGSDKAVAEDHAAAPGRAEAGVGAGPAAGGDAGRSSGENAGSADKPPRLTAEHVIRTATLTVRVKDVSGAVGDARTAVEAAGGHVGDETTDRDPGGHEQSRLVLRVPQESYEELLEELSGAGELVERKVGAKDVTDQAVDVESRIKSQRASVARVRELMDRATDLGDIVTLEGELSSRQTELEALQAQQASLKERTAMATVTLVLSETAVKRDSGDEDPSFLGAVAGGWDAFVTALRWVAVVLGAALPFLAALGVLALLWRAVRGRLPRRAAPAGPEREE